MLNSYRALELTDKHGALCGKILADLGAEVIKIERPGGDTSRNESPFLERLPGPERSLYWAFYNQGKKSITLDIETADGRHLFKRLAQTSDFIIESFTPGYMDVLDLGYDEISRLNPRIVMTSITPFGQTGPYKNFAADDITLMAMGGLMYVTGDPDRPPLRISIPQAYLLAGAQAAAATMTAHHYRQKTGEGQHIDVSAQECVMSVLANILPLWELSQVNLKRVGSFMTGRGTGALKQRLLFPCKDGSISFTVMGGPLLAEKNRAVVKWMEQEGMADDFISGWDWDKYDLSTATQNVQSRLEEYFTRFFLTHTKAEIYDQGLKLNFMVAPVSEPKDILNNPQLRAREFWSKVELPQGANVTSPGAYFRSPSIPAKEKRRAPRIGEHNLEIYENCLKLTKMEILALKQAGVI